MPKIILHSLILISLSFFISSCHFITVKKNERAVMFKRFDGGLDTTTIYQPGKYFISKANKLRIYNVDTIISNQVFTIPSNDTIDFQVSLTIKFKAIPEKIAMMAYYIGKDFEYMVVVPTVFSEFTNYFSNYSALQIQSKLPQLIVDDLKEVIEVPLRSKYIELISIHIDEIVSTY